MARVDTDYFKNDVLEVAPGLVGKTLVRMWPNGEVSRYMITETEVYRGAEDLACHVSKGRTARTEVMYHEGGHIYVYLIYGMYWMLNFVTGEMDNPQAVLIRGIEGFDGPGKLTKHLQVDRGFYGKLLSEEAGLWVENPGLEVKIKTGSRVGINYAGEPWISKPWRYMFNEIIS